MAEDIPFNNARGEASTLQMAPPFAFSDVKMTVFPLQANLARLTQFCNSYLNQAGRIVQFRPFLPFVYLIILDYGRMSAPAAQTGWVSQREVAFGVPLQWLEPDASGEMAFKDMAFTTPFIFVDNELSLSTGREVYGWPKLLARLDPRIDEWVRDPHGARQVFEIRSRAAADRAGDDLKAPFLSVTQTPLTGLLDIPPNLRSVAQAVTAWPQAIVGMARTVRDAGSALGGIAIEKVRKADSLSDLCKLGGTDRILSRDEPSRLLTARHWAELADGLRGMFPRLYSNTINLKQFRDAENPMETCYQAITAARMPITRFGGGGFLGSQNLLMGQIDGGYRINIINTSTVPVVSQLGLVEAGQQVVDGGVLSSFAPVCPFWVEIDMIYDLGETLAVRTRSGDWRTPFQSAAMTSPVPRPRPSARPAVKAEPGGTTPGASGDTGAAPPRASRPLDDTAEDAFLARERYLIEAANPFNTTRGASEAMAGVFRFPNARIRVLPLLADRQVLQGFVRDYMQVPGHMRVEAWGNHVYMYSAQYERITSDQSPGWTDACNEVTFAVPVKCYDWEQDPDCDIPVPDDIDVPDRSRWQFGASQMVGTAIVTPFNYVDSIGAAITESEIFGVPTLRSEIVSPPEGWAAASADRGVLLETRAIVVPSLGTQSEGTRKTLIEVRDSPMVAPADLAEWRQVAADWGPRLAEDLLRKRAETRQGDHDDGNAPWFKWGRAMALRIMGGLHGIDTLSLKQFRDAQQPENACYQGIVLRGRQIGTLHGLEEIDRDLTVSITRYPTQPIVETLGLIPKRTVVTDAGVQDEFEPLRPFELHADLVFYQGRTLFERSQTREWDVVSLPDGPLGWRPATEDEVERAHGATPTDQPAPKISYVRYDEQTARPARLKPLLLSPREMEAFRTDVRRRNVSDMLMLWRGVELGTLNTDSVLAAMDEYRVKDIRGFVRTRPSPESGDGDSAGGAATRISELAGSLEFISPATILDAVLSRGWASRRRGRDRLSEAVEDFRLRRNALGPLLAERLFPARESQAGCWPRSYEFAYASNLRAAAAENSLPGEFRKFVTVAESFQEELGDVRTLAQQTLPPWFYASVFEGSSVLDKIFAVDLPVDSEDSLELSPIMNGLKNAVALLGAWPTQYKVELDQGIRDFFDRVQRQGSASGRIDQEITFIGREWIRTTGRLVRDAVPDSFRPGDKLNLDVIMTHDAKNNPPTPGWLQARLEQLATDEPEVPKRIRKRADAWETAVKALWANAENGDR